MTDTESPFPRPDFVPELTDYAAFHGHPVGLTGHRGTLGGILHRRLREAGVVVEAYAGDVNDATSLSNWFAAHRFGHFFHFAAVVPVTRVEEDPVLAYRTNVAGTCDVCAGLLRTQPRCRLFLASSSHVYRPTPQPVGIAEDAATSPPTFYGQTKLAAERAAAPLLDKLGTPYCIGRIFSFSHRTQQEPYLVPRLRRRISELRDGQALDLDDPSSVRDIQDAETVIDCVLALASRGATGTVNIGTGRGLTVKQIALAVARTLGKSLEIRGKDRGAPGCLVADTTKLRALLGW